MDLDITMIGEEDTAGGNDTIKGYEGDDMIEGGAGDDIIEGDEGDDNIKGGQGDDKIYGGLGSDTIRGDDENGLLFGDDKIFGGEGVDMIYGGLGNDMIYGDEGADMIYGGAGEDTLYGGAGDDTINADRGWDTIFGGEGCDVITSHDGGDVVWMGECDGSSDQKVIINGTGDNPENFTVVMDFWLEASKPWNQLCLDIDDQQSNPTAGICDAGNSLVEAVPLCISAAQLSDPDLAVDSITDLTEGHIRGSGCKVDGGPLWVSIPLVDDPVVAAAGTGTYPQTVWARIFQRAP